MQFKGDSESEPWARVSVSVSQCGRASRRSNCAPLSVATVCGAMPPGPAVEMHLVCCEHPALRRRRLDCAVCMWLTLLWSGACCCVNCMEA